MDRRSLLRAVALLPAAAAPFGAADHASGKRLPGSSFIETADGPRLFYRDWGVGRPVVFVAPWALNSSWWEYQTSYLSEYGLRCIGYDRRGHGRSTEPGWGYDFDTLADDLSAVIEGLKLRDVTLVGHSMGAGEVVRYLSRHRAAHVRGAVLVAPITPFTLKTADNPDGVERDVLEKGRAALSLDRPARIAEAAKAFFGAEKNAPSKEIMDWWTQMIVTQCSLEVMLVLHRVFTETDFRADLRTIKVPTLIVHGDSDTSTALDLTGRRTAAMIANSQLKVYENAAHGLPVTHAARLNSDILAFVKG